MKKLHMFYFCFSTVERSAARPAAVDRHCFRLGAIRPGTALRGH
jgi:hypothetical protein